VFRCYYILYYIHTWSDAYKSINCVRLCENVFICFFSFDWKFKTNSFFISENIKYYGTITNIYIEKNGTFHYRRLVMALTFGAQYLHNNLVNVILKILIIILNILVCILYYFSFDNALKLLKINLKMYF